MKFNPGHLLKIDSILDFVIPLFYYSVLLLLFTKVLFSSTCWYLIHTN